MSDYLNEGDRLIITNRYGGEYQVSLNSWTPTDSDWNFEVEDFARQSGTTSLGPTTGLSLSRQEVGRPAMSESAESLWAACSRPRRLARLASANSRRRSTISALSVLSRFFFWSSWLPGKGLPVLFVRVRHLAGSASLPDPRKSGRHPTREPGGREGERSARSGASTSERGRDDTSCCVSKTTPSPFGYPQGQPGLFCIADWIKVQASVWSKETQDCVESLETGQFMRSL